MSASDLDYRLKGSLAGAWKIAAGVGVVGIGAAFALGASDMKRFAFSYLFAFATFLTLAIGGTFFVLFQHVTSAGWSVTVRRLAEFFMSALPVFALLFVPIAINVDNLYSGWASHEHAAVESHGAPGAGGHHTGDSAAGGHGVGGPATAGAAGAVDGATAPSGHGEGHPPTPAHGQAAPGGLLAQEQIEHLVHGEVIAKKAGYLNKPFFFGRAVAYFLLWLLVSQRLFKLSTSQDSTRDKEFTRRMQGMAPWAIPVMALTSTFAAFDWYMSLQPSWYSTMFGVYHFATCIVAIFAALTLTAMWLRKRGDTGEMVTVEHFHDLGKLLFGFNCFWAYISFSQFFLIWYAAIPEEVEFYHLRWSEGPWTNVSWAICALHFVVPFVLLMSRNVKRSLSGLASGAILLAVMHVVEMYWLVMPNYAASMGVEAREPHALSLHLLDVLCLLGVGGVYFAAVLYRAAQHPIVAVGDPRLDRSRHFENA